MTTAARRRHALPLISRCEVAAGKTQTITTHSELEVTLWVERGRVEVRRTPRGAPIATIDGPRPVPLGPGEVHVRNPDRSPAVVFAAMTEREAAAPAPSIRPGLRARPKEGPIPAPSLAAPAPSLAAPAPSLATRSGAARGGTRFHVQCSEHGLLTADPVSHQEAVGLQRGHRDDFPEHPTEILRAAR